MKIVGDLPFKITNDYSAPKSSHGIRIKVRRDLPLVAKASGLWPFKSIVLGGWWFHLDGAEKQAVLLHEVGHCKHWHMEKRVLWIALALLTPKLWRGLLKGMDNRATADIRQWMASKAGRQWMRDSVPRFLIDVFHDQEYEADEFAARRGYGVELISAILKIPDHPEGSVLYPTHEAREKMVKELNHG